MSLTFRDIEGVKDDDQFLISGKDLKELLDITRAVRSGPDRIHYYWGGQLTRIVCGVERAPDIDNIVQGILGGMSHGNT